MQYSQKYTLVAFLKPIEVDAEFHMADWPVHVTLADVFAIDRVGTSLDAKLKDLLAGQAPVVVTASGETMLGGHHVVLLDKTEELQALHDRLVDLLEADGAQFNTPEFTRGGFLPHCTIQKSGCLQVGDTVTLDVVGFVDMFPGGDWRQRKVIDVYKLQGGSVHNL